MNELVNKLMNERMNVSTRGRLIIGGAKPGVGSVRRISSR